MLLSPRVVEILKSIKSANVAPTSYVFPHPRRTDRPASENAVLYALSAMGFKERMSGHGFRSLFSTIANEAKKDKDVIEACLGHRDPDLIRGAYNKAEWLGLRRELINWYADDCNGSKIKTAPETSFRRTPDAYRPGYGVTV